MLRSALVTGALAVLACNDSKPAPPAATPEALPAGPVPVALPKIDAKRLRVLTSVKEFVVLDSGGSIRWGKPASGPTPWTGEPVERSRNIGDAIHYDLDSYGKLSRDASATAVILADSATPARITLVDGIQAYPYKPVALAASAANLAVPYQFGDDPWSNWEQHADLIVRVDRLELGAQKPRTVLLQFTDATTTGELLTALAAIAETGAERVRLHRMMGWGEIGPSDIVWVHGPESDDDEITPGPPAKVAIAQVRVDDTLTASSVETALTSATPRFRYCYEKGPGRRPGSLELSFDVSADGTITNATAKGFNRALDSCVAGALFDARVPTGGVKAAGHATASVTFDQVAGNASAAKESKPITGFWCWTHQNGKRGMCARDNEECEASSRSFNQLAPATRETPNTNACKAQKSAWEASSPNTLTYPTKALCKALEMTDTCRNVR